MLFWARQKVNKAIIYSKRSNIIRLSHTHKPRIDLSFGIGRKRNTINIGGYSYSQERIETEFIEVMNAIFNTNPDMELMSFPTDLKYLVEQVCDIEDPSI